MTLVVSTVLWVLASLWTVLWYAVRMMHPGGWLPDKYPSLPDGVTAWVYGIAAVLVLWVVPLILGWAAYTNGTSLWACLFYLTPHVLFAAWLAYGR